MNAINVQVQINAVNNNLPIDEKPEIHPNLEGQLGPHQVIYHPEAQAPENILLIEEIQNPQQPENQNVAHPEIVFESFSIMKTKEELPPFANFDQLQEILEQDRYFPEMQPFQNEWKRLSFREFYLTSLIKVDDFKNKPLAEQYTYIHENVVKYDVERANTLVLAWFFLHPNAISQLEASITEVLALQDDNPVKNKKLQEVMNDQDIFYTNRSVLYNEKNNIIKKLSLLVQFIDLAIDNAQSSELTEDDEQKVLQLKQKKHDLNNAIQNFQQEFLQLTASAETLFYQLEA